MDLVDIKVIDCYISFSMTINYSMEGKLVTRKHRFMMNMDPDLYEWLREVSHQSRKSISRILNESVRQIKEGVKEEHPCEAA